MAPLLLSMIFLFVEFDRYIVTVHALEEASRVGCRMAVLEGSSLEDVESEVSRILTPFDVDGYSLTVTPDIESSIGFGNPVSVSISVSYDDVAWLPTPKFLAGKTISTTCTLPKEK